jgi:hypothetical protein
MKTSKTALSEAIAVTAELTGTDLSENAALAILGALKAYPEYQVLGALNKCMKELRGRMTLADIICRLDDGRPGAEEAWAMLPRNEYVSVVWTDEMRQSMSVVHDLIDEDKVAARMAFKETYMALCSKARDEGTPVNWSVSLGYDKNGRETAIKKALELGRLSVSQAKIFIPDLSDDEIAALLPNLENRRLLK